MDFDVWHRLNRGDRLAYVKQILPAGKKWDILFQVLSDNRFGFQQISHDAYHYPSNADLWLRSEVENTDTEESYQRILYLFIPDSDDAGTYYKYGDASNETLDLIISFLMGDCLR